MHFSNTRKQQQRRVIVISLRCEWSGTQVVVATLSVFDQSAAVSPTNSASIVPEPSENTSSEPGAFLTQQDRTSNPV